jgi:maltooligosyltrehalose trehalohydrolase
MLSGIGDGYHLGELEDVSAGSLYFYRLDGEKERPDPASRHQPKGVHGPSRVTDSRYVWKVPCWCGLSLSNYILYELHVGTFTPEGTFEAVIPRLARLKELGITAIELMPVAQFPGTRNWGYDGVYPFAVQESYGGPEGLKHLVDACHGKGLAVVLDVVYNHLGPEGNHLSDFGPYFTDFYKTPWGRALNFDGPESDHVRRFSLENARYWISELHMDALRVDAVHAILDFSAVPFVRDLTHWVHGEAERTNRRIHVIAESALNDTRIIRPPELGGYGMDAQWNDDFHHALHALLTGERTGYYCDFGRFQDLLKAFREGFIYSGRYSAYRRRRHGNSSLTDPAERFVVFSQNHDQVGNRMRGERLGELVSFEAAKLAAAAVLLSPFVPLLFMGEENGEKSPFPYFISHSDPKLVEAVRQGRKAEFSAFGWQGEPPDPADRQTFLSAKLRTEPETEENQVLFRFYRELIRLRKGTDALSRLSKENLEVTGIDEGQTLLVRRWSEKEETLAVFHFLSDPGTVVLPIPEGRWEKTLDSSEAKWMGPGSTVPDKIDSGGRVSLSLTPHGVVLLLRGET